MLDELRDYPLSLSRMFFAGYGDGILEGCSLRWEQDVLYLEPGLLHYHGDIYRMEEPCPLACTATDQLTYLKVRFATMDYERGKRGGMGRNPAQYHSGGKRGDRAGAVPFAGGGQTADRI